MRVDFTIPSAPVPKSRPRFNTNTGRAFTDDKTRIFENIVSLAYGARHYFDDNYIRIRMKFKFEVPKSYSKKKRIDALEGKIRPTKADIDNYIKSVLDGLNGKAFKDDRYVCKRSKYRSKYRKCIGGVEMTKEEYSEIFRKTEGKLFDYKNIRNEIEAIELEIEDIKNEYRGCGSISYEERTGPTYNISRSVENEVIKKEERINYLEYIKKKKEIKKKKIEIAINNFSIEQKELFNVLYMSNKKKVPRHEILDKMHISKTTYYELRESLVRSAISSMHPDILERELFNNFTNSN